MISVRTFAILLGAGGLSASSGFSLRRSHRVVGAVGSTRRALAAAPRTSLSLSASALIVQNKGGGHGELGYQLARNLISNDKISSITILQDSARNPAKEPFASYSTDLPNVRIVEADLGDESTTAEDVMSLLGGGTYDYVWDNASKGDTGAGKAVVDCAKAWKSRMLVFVSSAGIYKPDGTVSFFVVLIPFLADLVCVGNNPIRS
jgi:hypothetical protein